MPALTLFSETDSHTFSERALTMRSALIRLAIGILAMPLLAIAGSAADKRAGDSSDYAKAEAAAVDGLWTLHVVRVEMALATARSSGVIKQTQFSESIAFLEEATGIPANTATYLGDLPTPPLEDALSRWKKWYTENRTGLRLDTGRCRVVRK